MANESLGYTWVGNLKELALFYTGGRVSESSQRECRRVHKEGEDLRQQGNAVRTVCKGRLNVWTLAYTDNKTMLYRKFVKVGSMFGH